MPVFARSFTSPFSGNGRTRSVLNLKLFGKIERITGIIPRHPYISTVGSHAEGVVISNGDRETVKESSERFAGPLKHGETQINGPSGAKETTLFADAPSQLSKNVRFAMRKVPHAVVVVTASTLESHKPNTETDFTGPRPPPLQHGMLVSSFNTVTLQPEPVVSFNVKVPSKTYDAIAESGYFEVSPMYGQAIAEKFAQSRTNTSGGKTLPSKSQLEGARSFGLRCEWLKDKSIKIGDHLIMVGKVVEFLHRIGGREQAVTLLYCAGSYRFPSAPTTEIWRNGAKKEKRTRELAKIATMAEEERQKHPNGTKMKT